jgi:lipopolysaccharide transport system ATP-binding protein
MSGDVFDVTQAYLAWHERKSAPDVAADNADRHNVEFSVLDAELNGHAGTQPVLLEHGDMLSLRARFRSRDGRVPSIAVGIVRADGTPVYGVSSEMDGHVPRRIAPNEYACELQFPDLPLLPGSYTVRVHPMDPEGVRIFDTLERSVTIRGATREFGLVRLAHRWDTGEVTR